MREFLHWLSTSRYTRHLEAENAELRQTVQKLVEAVTVRKRHIPAPVPQSNGANHASDGAKARKMEQSVRIKRPGWTEVRAKETYWTDQEIQFEKTSAANLAGLQ